MKKWLVILSLGVFNIAQAGTLYTGEIVSINNRTISFDDESYILSPTVKVWTLNREKTGLQALTRGESVALELIKVGKNKMVDHIYIQRQESEDK